jgi:hypothetical protein
MRTLDGTGRVVGDAGRSDAPARTAARARVTRVALDTDYPCLSAAVQQVHSLTLDQLADRCPCDSTFQFFDLERLLAGVRDSPLFNDPEYTRYSDAWMQVRGYLATFDAYLALSVVKNPALFITKKLLAPLVPLPAPPKSGEMLDTLAECSWGIWFHERHGNLEEEKPLPGAIGNVDFFVTTTTGPLWIDIASIASDVPRDDMVRYLAMKVRTKWREKFGARSEAADLPAGIAVTLLKKQENVIHALIRDELTETEYLAPPELWTDCPALQRVWFATAPWDSTAHRPTIFTTWTRP